MIIMQADATVSISKLTPNDQKRYVALKKQLDKGTRFDIWYPQNFPDDPIREDGMKGNIHDIVKDVNSGLPLVKAHDSDFNILHYFNPVNIIVIRAVLSQQDELAWHNFYEDVRQKPKAFVYIDTNTNKMFPVIDDINDILEKMVYKHQSQRDLMIKLHEDDGRPFYLNTRHILRVDVLNR